MENKSLTLTIVANLTSNYGESLGNISTVQKFYKNGKTYTMRSKESLKYAIMSQSGLYNDLSIKLDKVAQKEVGVDKNVSSNMALEGGYMSTSKEGTFVRNSSFYVTDAVSCNEFVNDYRFHNNLNMARTYAEANGMNVQKDAAKVGLNPFNYEFEKSLKKYSITIDLEKIGKDENFTENEASNEDKAQRILMIIDAVKNLSTIVKGNMDNAEPIFVVGGLSPFKTHYFENVVRVENGTLRISEDLIGKIGSKCNASILSCGEIKNEEDVKHQLNTLPMEVFFSQLVDDIKSYYGVK